MSDYYLYYLGYDHVYTKLRTMSCFELMSLTRQIILTAQFQISHKYPIPTGSFLSRNQVSITTFVI